MDEFNKAGWNYTSWAYKTNNSGSWGIYQEKTTQKVNPTSDSLADIKAKWSKIQLAQVQRVVMELCIIQ